MRPPKGPRNYAYSEVTLAIREDVRRGKYRPGARLPTLVELAEQYKVSHSTVRLAIKQLAADGLLQVHQGSGTFVAPEKQAYNPLEGFAEQFESTGHVARTLIDETRWLDPLPPTKAHFKLADGEKVWVVMKYHYLDETAVIAEVIELPRHVADHFLGDSKKLRSIFSVLREELGYTELDVALTRIDVSSDRVYADLLDVPPGTVFYEIHRLLSSDGKPVMMSGLAVRSDVFCLALHTARHGFEDTDGEVGFLKHDGRQGAIQERFVEMCA
jgi:DNA-binding GntR family transcriptional regulator